MDPCIQRTMNLAELPAAQCCAQLEALLQSWPQSYLARQDLAACKVQRRPATTVVYIEAAGSWPSRYLFLYRNRKPNDVNAGKYIGVGGKVEAGESFLACARREVREETGLLVQDLSCTGFVLYLASSEVPQLEWMAVFRAQAPAAELAALRSCAEGDFSLLSLDEFLSGPRWEGDEVFIRPSLRGQGFGLFELVYSGEALTAALQLPGRDLPEPETLSAIG